jgi:ubiquinone/menaquinone biosynthesis C-methylase UbiE
MNDVLKVMPTALAIVALVLVVGQCRKPRGWVGRFYAWLMGVRHAGVTTWGLSHLAVAPQFVILDVGCGGGAAVERLAAIASEGSVHGIDCSSASVAAARSRNRAEIAEGRVEIQQASVSALPFGERSFELVTAVETHYYWPEPATDFREILRVLKPGGRLAIIAETYRGQTFGALMNIPMMLLRARYLTVEEHRQLFISAGFIDVVVHTDARKGWICVVGRKP